MKYAEDLTNYWTTGVDPFKSQAEIQRLLHQFGVKEQAIATGHTPEGRTAWLVKFKIEGMSFRFIFTPLPCKYPDRITSFRKKRRTHEEQAVYQMGRVALAFVKAILTAAKVKREVLFGFMELPGVRDPQTGRALTAAELGASGIVELMKKALPPGTPKSDPMEISPDDGSVEA